MPAASARKIGSFFSHEVLEHLGMPADLRLLPQLTQAWAQAAGEPLCYHVQPTRYARGQLNLCADSSTWASKIRYQQQDLIDRLRQISAFRHLIGLQVRIVPPGESRRSAPRPVARNPLSSANLKLLEQVACDIADPTLRAALARLGRTQTD